MTGLAGLRRPVFAPLHGFSEESVSAFLTMSSSEHMQIGGGRLGGEIGVAPFDRSTLRRTHFTVDMRAVVTMGPQVVHLVFADDAPTGARVCGVHMRSGMMMAVDSGAHADARLGAGIRWSGLRVPKADFARAWASQTERDMPWREGLAFASPPPALGGVLSRSLAALETVARGRPEAFEDPTWRRNAEASLVDRYVATLVHGVDDGAAESFVAAASIVRDVDELLHASPEPARTVTELCAGLRIGRRTLERSFAGALGLSPKEYLQSRALRAVRQDLLDPDAIDETVTSVAMRHGFWHLGRFAQVYRLRFGESPSETRRRTAQRVRPRTVATWFDMTGERGAAARMPAAVVR